MSERALRAGQVGNDLLTERLRLRRWCPEDAAAALVIYGDREVASRLSQPLRSVAGVGAMERILREWIAQDERLAAPSGRWAVERRQDGRLVGGAFLLPLPPGEEDLEFGWHTAREHWGQGYASEAGRALAGWAFDHGEEELFAVVRTGNVRAASVAQRIGMEWVGETDKYYGLTLQVYRVRRADLLPGAAGGPRDLP
ncbi:MAG TPA: GNAT family N-acetyltransferase [Kineosporiaceae bacterium]